MQEVDENARGKGKIRGKQHPTRVSWLLSWVQRADQESYTCYVLFVLIFILDFSLLTMLFPVSLAAYALATQRPSRLYWQVSPFAVHWIGLHCELCCAVLCCAVLTSSSALPPLNCLDAWLQAGLLVDLFAGFNFGLLSDHVMHSRCSKYVCTHVRVTL